MEGEKAMANLEGEHKVSIVAVLTMVEFMAAKYIGERKYTGLVMRELKKGADTLLDRFADLMVEFEAEFKAIDHEKIDPKHKALIDSLFGSWKKNGVSIQFNADVRTILFDKDAMPVYLDNPHDRAFLAGFVQCFK